MYRVMQGWLTWIGICVFCALAWVGIGMALLVFRPDPLLLIVALVCLIAACGIEFTDTNEGDFR